MMTFCFLSWGACLQLCLTISLASISLCAHSAPQPLAPEFIALDALRPGMRGEVWTVFRGTEPEPFEVEFTGVLHNALGTGKSLILCQLTDPRVQHMGAVAGMSGSPLYIDGKLAGALSYQVQKFETVRYAGFTPVADLLEVGEKAAQTRPREAAPMGNMSKEETEGLRPLSPLFILSGVSPQVTDWLRPQLASLGLKISTLGGQRAQDTASDELPTGTSPIKKNLATLRPGDAVAVALSTGDIALAATGTVSYVADDRLIAFGHPMMGLGEVALPMARADIVAILPSSESSVKVANTGELIGTLTQDRLSAVAGYFGEPPPLLPIEVTIGERTLHYRVVQHPQLTPLAIGIGAAQAAVGTNDAGLAQGARLMSTFHFAGEAPVTFETLLPGPQASLQGIGDLVRGINALMQNPYAITYPTEVKLHLTPLAENPITTLETVQLSRSEISPGETFYVTLQWRNFQGEVGRERVAIPISPEWLGKTLEVIVARGELLDQITGRQFIQQSTQLRSFSAYLDFVRTGRSSEGLTVAVVEPSRLFLDQATSTRELPQSLARIATRSDSIRYQHRRTQAILWETQILPHRLIPTASRHPFRVID